MLPDYELAVTLLTDGAFELRRGRRTRTGAPVLMKVARAAPARPADAAALRRECALALGLPSASILLPRVVETNQGSALVMEDPGGELLPMARRAGRAPFDATALLGAQLADALAELHARGIVHRGLRPEIVLCDAARAQAWLVDLGDAHTLASTAVDASVLSATRLVYAAPEQTGRMDCTSDQRSDLYSLGVLLYECLCGVPPFEADDALELIHRHLAATPIEPHRRDPSIPEPLSALVMRLLAKSPDERYQTARGLADDLRRCAREWAQHARIEPFALGQRDASGQLVISRKLYGREREVQQLLATFERACAGNAGSGEMLVVEGYAGIGKTALIQQLYRPIVRQRGYFISGKFDQVARGVPFGALIQAFRALVQQLLTEPEERLAMWRRSLTDALGGNGGVLAEVMPEIEFIVGPQPAPAQLGSNEAQNRFQRVLQNFVGALARPEHPLVLFLDDLQWADAATLALLEPLLGAGERRCLLLLGAYREHESDTPPRLARTLAALEAAGLAVQRLVLGPLQPRDLCGLVADTLRCDAQAAEPLAQLVLRKTGGNPFFVTQFLRSLEREGHLRFDTDAARWTYRIAEIADAPLADNVIELMTRSIERLPAKSQYALTLAACIGNRFDARTLAIVSEQTAAQTADDLALALDEGLLVVAAPGGAPTADVLGAPEGDRAYTFLHDRVQQAAYALIPPQRRRMVHLTVGRLLRSRTPPGQLDTRRFEIVQHLNLGSSLIADRAERLGVAALNLDAGRKAKASTAHDTALELFAAGIELLDPAAWHDEHELAFELQLEAAESRYLCGQFEPALADFERLLARTLAPIERARVIRLRSVQYENLARYAESIATVREGVAMFGVTFPDDEAGKLRALDAEIVTIDRLRGGRSVASLEELPRMTDPQVRMVASMLTDIWSAAYLVGDPTLARLISATLVRLSLEHGNVEESAYGYVTHAITVGAVRGDPAQAYEYGCLALAVNARFDDTSRRAKIYQQFHAHVNFWCRPFDTCAAYAREACRSGLESGDFLYAAYGAGTEPWAAMAATQDLARFEREHEPNIALIERLKNRGFADSVRVLVNWARALQGRTDAPLSLGDASFDEQAYLASYRDSPFFTTIHAIARLQLCCLLGSKDEAAAAARHAAANVHHLPGTVWPVIFDFWNALTLAASFDGAAGAEHGGGLDEIRAAQRRFDSLSACCEQNFRSQALLLAAEIARVEGRTAEALGRYEDTIEFAAARPLLPFMALAHERSGRLLVETGRLALGRMHLAQARAGYARWGAQAKVDVMSGQYPMLAARADVNVAALPAQAGAEAAAAAPPAVEHPAGLDLFSVMKAAQAIAAETEVDGLLARLVRIAIENAGAERGALVLEAEAGPIVHAFEALATAPAGEPVALDHAVNLPVGIVNYVRRTASSVVLAQADSDEQHGADPYIARWRPRSIICVAAQHQGRLVGVLYLENRHIGGAFTAERVRVLQSLTAQAAIALENARLRRELEAENSYLRRDLIANVSHDLRTPLVSIRGYLEVLAAKHEVLDPAQRRSYLDTAVRQSEHLGTLIDELFELAKLDFKGITLQREAFQLAELVSDVLQKFRLMAAGRQVALELEASHELPLVHADLGLIERAFDNLIGNALKHTPAGGCVTVRLQAGSGSVDADVIDTGAGIAANDLPFIFDRFYRGGGSAGAGLGLAITRRIVELHAGTITVQSSAAGSSFRFGVPTLAATAADRRA
jgi:predicted ATPase/signal transduction histidine kinase